MSPRYQAVTFDAGGTLFHMERPVGEVYSEFASKFGCQTDPKILEIKFQDLFRKNSASSADAGHLTPEDERKWWKALVHELFHSGGDVIPEFDRFFDELHEYFAQPGLWKMYPEAQEVLEKLNAAGVRMAIVSNWDTRLPMLLSRLGVDRFMKAVVVSAIEGASKPDRRIFGIALDRLGIPAGLVVHVGDSMRDDIRGAMAAGLGAIWLKRDAVGAGAGEGEMAREKNGFDTARDLKEAARFILES